MPFVSFLSTQGQNATSANPTVAITEVDWTFYSEIDVTFEATLPGYSYDYYVKNVYLFVNQSEAFIIDNEYESYNASKSYSEQLEETFESSILSPSYDEEPFKESAYYNISLIAVTNTGKKSNVTFWSDYIFIDNDRPTISFITPSTNGEVIWGYYDISVKVQDKSGLDFVKIKIDDTVRYTFEEPDPSIEIFNWTWLTSNHTRGLHTVNILTQDATPRENSYERYYSVKIDGPYFEWNEGPPSYVDYNESLYLNMTVKDGNHDVSSVKINYSLDDGSWQNGTFDNPESDIYNYSLPKQPLGTKINYEIIANNSEGMYQVLRNEELEPFEIYSVYPDHIKPTAKLYYEKQIQVNEDIIVKTNVTEQSVLNACQINYRIDFEGEWQEAAMNMTSSGGYNNTWYYYEYEFEGDYPVFTIIQFYIEINDSANNSLVLNRSGLYYEIKVMPIDLAAPNITIQEIPDEIINGRNISVTVSITDDSNLANVWVFYEVNLKLFKVEMEHQSGDIWTADFAVEANTGESVEIWIRAVDEYYNSVDSEITKLDVKSQKKAGGHSNAWVWILFFLILIIPIVITFFLLRPQQ
jgi:hypothetical protein